MNVDEAVIRMAAIQYVHDLRDQHDGFVPWSALTAFEWQGRKVPLRHGGHARYPAMAAEAMFHATCLAPHTAQTLRALGDLEPSTLAIMHGASFQGDGKKALYELAAAYEGLQAAS